jgi:rubredoxin
MEKFWRVNFWTARFPTTVGSAIYGISRVRYWIAFALVLIFCREPVQDTLARLRVWELVHCENCGWTGSERRVLLKLLPPGTDWDGRDERRECPRCGGEDSL